MGEIIGKYNDYSQLANCNIFVNFRGILAFFGI